MRSPEPDESPFVPGPDDVAGSDGDPYRSLFYANPQPMWIYDVETLGFLEVNDSAIDRYGYSRGEFLRLSIIDLRPPEDVSALMENLSKGAGILDRSGPWRHRTRDGSIIQVEITSHSVVFGGRSARFVMASDVTERIRLQNQLAQSQRLQSLGQLAGGVAHDFNNLLGVIINFALFVREELEGASAAGDARWDLAKEDLRQIERAAERAAELTRQLLAFARREVVQPRVLDLNEVVADLEPLLRRTIGEQIELAFSLGPDLWPVEADPGQMEQVLVNLAVNARDAMPSGGKLSVETGNVDVDDAYAAVRPDLAIGPYVVVRVSDTGTGMDATTIERAFEPFFTTKPTGEGTGLGLATVYGIITQAGGSVRLYSEPGRGTTLSALLPAVGGTVEATDRPDEPPHRQRGGTVLVVEDEDAIREAARRLLVRHGYEVLTASDGAEAIEVAVAREARIDLLMTDVVMPGMQGKEVADRIVALHPEARVLFVSGYARSVLGEHVTAPGAVLLEKPFTEKSLLATLDQLIAEDDTSAPT